MKRTKIVCTIGPASDSKTKIEKMFKAGMNVARLNFSHGTYASHTQLIQRLRQTAKKLNQPFALVQDLQGPRIRIGKVDKNGIELGRQDKVILVPEDEVPQEVFAEALEKDYKVLPIQYKELYTHLKEKDSILINDGLIDLRVDKIKGEVIYTKVKKPGIVFSHKGLNLPGVRINTEVITAKDKQDIKFGLKQKVDYMALSFVHEASDITKLRKLINKDVKIIAKIETREAVNNFEEILEATDAIMIARGDLGIELPVDKVPLLQKKMIKKCLEAAKPVIVATQMLESMILSARPTRAEVSDVANAVIDHTDAVMLSGESAYGKYPVESVRMMKSIIMETEKSIFDDVPPHYFKLKHPDVAETIASSVDELVKEKQVKVVVVNSHSGYAARLISRHRPENIIAVLTNNPITQRQLVLSWGVYPFLVPTCRSVDALIKSSVQLVKKEKLAKKNDRVVIYTGQPLSKEGMSLVKVQTI